MIRANIAELKNRLSHYLRLVRGGEVVEIIDRKTPLARIARVGMQPDGGAPDVWIDEVCAMGLVSRPGEPMPVSRLADPAAVIPVETGGTLATLLEERSEGR